MKSDAAVLTEAISTLEREGMWCQGAWVKTSKDQDGVGNFTTAIMAQSGQVETLGMCAEGAIRMAADWFRIAKAEEHLSGFNDSPVYVDATNQVLRIEARVRDKLVNIREDVRDALIAERMKAIEEYVRDHPDSLEANLTGEKIRVSLHNLNDHEAMRASDIILAMKHTLADIA